MERDTLTEKIIGAAIEVHRVIGPGLLESAYEECLAYELKQAKLRFRRQVPLPVVYKEVRLDCGYRIDLLVEDDVVVELKAVEKILPVHDAQLLTYMKLSGAGRGLILNFHCALLRDGIRRMRL
jgi:GxxExxY protein